MTEIPFSINISYSFLFIPSFVVRQKENWMNQLETQHIGIGWDFECDFLFILVCTRLCVRVAMRRRRLREKSSRKEKRNIFYVFVRIAPFLLFTLFCRLDSLNFIEGEKETHWSKMWTCIHSTMVASKSILIHKRDLNECQLSIIAMNYKRALIAHFICCLLRTRKIQTDWKKNNWKWNIMKKWNKAEIHKLKATIFKIECNV